LLLCLRPLFRAPSTCRDWNLCDFCAKSSTAFSTSAFTAHGFPFWMSRGFPPSIAVMSLKASPTLLRSSCLSSRSCGQSTNTWTTVSLAPHAHLSSSMKRRVLACEANHECPDLSCIIMYALFLCWLPYTFRVCLDGRPSSILRRCLPFSVVCHSFCHS